LISWKNGNYFFSPTGGSSLHSTA